MAALPPRARLFHLGVCLLGIGAICWALVTPAGPRPAPLWELALYGALALLAGGKKIQVIGRSRPAENGSLSLGIAVIFAAILRGGPHAGLAVALASCVSSCFYPKRQPAVQFSFNMGLTALQSWVSGLTFVWLNHGLAMAPAISLASAATTGVVYFALNSAGLAGIIGLCAGTSPLALWRQTAIQTGPTYLATAAVVALAVILSVGNVGALLLFGAPIAFLVYHSYAAGVQLDREKQLRIEELQTNEERLQASYARSARQARQERALAHMAMLAFSDVAIAEWMQQVVAVIARTVEIDKVALLECTHEGRELVLRAGVGWRDDAIGRATVPAGTESLSGYVLLNRVPVAVEAFRDEARFERGPLLAEHGVASALAAVVMSGTGAPWGVLGIYSGECRAYDPELQQFLQSAAHLVALALDRYRHAELLELRANEIGALNAQLRRAMAETHHRVKNNLQLISGLIDLETMDRTDGVPASELRRLGQHVCSLAAIHDLLTYQAKETGDVQSISTRRAFDRLLPLLRAVTGDRILHCEADDALLPANKAISLTILVNELVSNAAKHGSSEVDISLSVRGNSATLTVCDDGPGFPEGFSLEAHGHTGLELVESLSRWDLQGQSRYTNRPSGGAHVVVEFPVDGPGGHAARHQPGRGVHHEDAA